MGGSVVVQCSKALSGVQLQSISGAHLAQWYETRLSRVDLYKMFKQAAAQRKATSFLLLAAPAS